MDTRPGQTNNFYLVNKSASVVTHSHSTKGLHAEKTTAVHESLFLETYPEDDINVWMKPPPASVVLLKKKPNNLSLKTKMEKNNKLVSRRPSPASSKGWNSHIARGPGNCSSTQSLLCSPTEERWGLGWSRTTHRSQGL